MSIESLTEFVQNVKQGVQDTLYANNAVTAKNKGRCYWANNIFDKKKEELKIETSKRRIFFDKSALGASWGAKIGPGDLNETLQRLESMFNPNVILGAEKLDDAGIYKISEDTALVQTLDYFTPIVKDPYVFGQIAAANVF